MKHLEFSDLITAVKSNTPGENAPYIKIMRVLLIAKCERADEEDGDEGILIISFQNAM